MTSYTDDDPIDPLLIQDDIDTAAASLAIAALETGPDACYRVASDLALTYEEAARQMGMNPAARPKLAAAIAEHVHQLRLLTVGWQNGDE
jgi:hypothetical protein